ncbi:lysosomal-trafficking regulator-like isoform X2 [Ptychodera flava]|uniref:lysosomal-trafficking regulator-like isoform X2 n=1 Tax=Ptychodera flava TaxID=63121 RepID=UPI003969C60D
MEHLYALLSRKVGPSAKIDAGDEHPQIPSEVLRTKWESYVKVVAVKSQDKSDRLEEFLHLFLAMVSDSSNNPEDLRDFSNDTGSVCNILAREFLSDVHNCCTSTECSNGDTRLLMNYLLHGRGWLLINALNELVTQTLSCTADLANLLVALIPLVLKIPVVRHQSNTDVDLVLSNIGVCFDILRTNQCFQPPYSRKHHSVDSGSYSLKSAKKDQKVKTPLRQTKKKTSSSRTKRRLHKERQLEDQMSSESDDNMSSFLQQKKSHSFPMLTQISNGARMETCRSHTYCRGQISSGQDSLMHSKMVPLRPLHVNQKGAKVQSELTSPVDLCLVLMSLLEKLSNSEISRTSHRGNIAISLIPQLIRLSALLNKFPGSDEESKSDVEPGDLEVEFADGWQEDTITVLQRVVLRVILKMCAITCLRQNGCSELSNNGTLTSVLELAIDINDKINSTFDKSERLTPDGKEDTDSKHTAIPISSRASITTNGSNDRLYFICEILQGLLMLISSIMQNLPLNLTFMSQTLHLLHEFSTSQGYALYIAAINELEESLAKLKSTDTEYHQVRDFISALVSNLTKVISAVKKAKVEYIHMMTCLKRKHRKCEFNRFMHHHHNVCGLSCIAFEETSHSLCDSLGSLDTTGLVATSGEKCCIASAVEVLLNAFERSSCKFTLLSILSNLELTGICCCVPPQSLISPILNRLYERPASVRSYALNFINKMVLEQLGGGVNIQTIGNEICNICSDSEPQTNRSSFIGSSTELIAGSYPDNLDSAIGSDASTHDEEQHSKWRVLSKYKDLLLSDDESLSVPVAKHLLHLVSHGNQVIKKVLFLHVFLPSFEVAKATTSGSDSQIQQAGKESMSMSVLEHCFNALPPLLTSSSAQELFLTHGGLKQLLELLHHDGTRSAVLRVFEVLIMAEDQTVEIQKKKRELYPRDSLFSSSEIHIGRSSDSSNYSSYDEVVMRGSKGSVSSGVSIGSFGVIDAFLQIVTDVVPYEHPRHDSLDLPTSEETTDKEESISSLTTSTTDTLEFVHSEECSVTSVDRKISVHSLHNLRTNSLDRKGSALYQSTLSQALDTSKRKSSSLTALKNLPSDQTHGKSNLPSLESSSIGSTQTLLPDKYDRNIILDLNDTEIQIAADVWKSCKNLYLNSCIFKEHFLEHGGAAHSHQVLKDTVSALNHYKAKDCVNNSNEFSTNCQKCKSGCVCDRDGLSDLFLLLECVLAICLDCAAMPTNNVHSQILSVEAEIAEIKGPLLESDLAQCSRGQELCDALLKSAVMQKANPVEFMQTTKTSQSSKLTVHFAPLSQDNISESSDDQSETSDVCVTEAGYDADSERDFEDKQKGGERVNSERDVSSDDNSIQTVLLHPQMCKLVLQLLSVNVNINNTDVICHGLQQLISIAKAKQAHSTAMYYDGLATCLLDVFSNILTTNQSEFDDIRSLLLELFVVLVKHNISSQELKTFIQFMKKKDAPLDPLLSSLSKVAGDMTRQPSHILCFPIKDAESYDQASLSKESSLSASSPVFEESSNTFTKHDTSLHMPVLESPWVTAPLQLPIRDSLNWKPSEKKFSISLWMRVEGSVDVDVTSDPTSKSHSDMFHRDSTNILDFEKAELVRKHHKDDDYQSDSLHIFSVGTKEVLFEMWYSPSINNIIFRLVDEAKDKTDTVVFEKFVSRVLTPGIWQHIAVSYSEKVDGSSTSGQIAVFADGHRQVDVLVDYKTQLSSSQGQSVHCLLGHYKKTLPSAMVWQMSNMMLFHDAVLNLDFAYHLYTLGPDCCTLCKCDASKQTANYEISISEDVLDAGLSYDLLTGATDMDIKALRESMVVTYSPRNINLFSLYQLQRQITRSVSIANILPNTNKLSNTDMIIQQAIPMQATLLTDMVPSVYRGLQNAVYEVGGMAVFIYMFAMVVERSSDEFSHSQALKLLLLLKTQSQQLAQEFQVLNGYGMVYRVLASNQCRLGQHMLKVLLDACCHGDTVLKGSPVKGYLTNHKSRAVIRDKELIRELLLAWRLWYDSDPEIWETLLDGFNILISDEHPYREFNIKQLQCAKTVEKILLTCKEIQSESLAPPPVSVCKGFVQLVQAMMGSPPDLDTVIAICDFLLVVHPAVSTFVCHAPSSFYFTQHTGPQQEYKQRLIVSTTASTVNSAGSSLADKHSPRESPALFSTSTPIKIQRRSRHTSITETSNESDNMRGSDPGVSRCMDDVKVMSKSSSFPTRKRIDWDTTEVAQSQRHHTDDVQVEESVQMKIDLMSELSRAMGAPTCRFYLGHSQDVSDTNKGDDWSCEDDAVTKAQVIQGNLLEDSTYKIEGDDKDTDSIIKPTDTSSKDSCKQSEYLDDGLNKNKSGEVETQHSMSTASTLKEDASSVNDEVLQSSSNDLKDFVVVKGIPPEDDPDAYLIVPEMETLSTSQITDMDALSVTADSLCSPPGEDGLEVMSTGLLKLLYDVVVTLPDNMVHKVIGLVIKPEILIVLSHHISIDIRTAIVKLLDMFFHRANNDKIAAFLKIKGFYLLANQLHQHGATRELIEACFTMTIGKPVSLDDDIEPSLLMDCSRLKQLSVIPIMALMENCIHDQAVCHNTLCLLIQLFDNVDSMAQVMLDNGLVEALCNVVSAINRIYKANDSDVEEERQLLLGDIEHFLACVVVRCCSMSGLQPFQQIDDLIIMLGILEDKEKEIYGTTSDAVKSVRKIRWYILKEAIEHIQSVFRNESDLGLSMKGYHGYSGGEKRALDFGAHRSHSVEGRFYLYDMENEIMDEYENMRGRSRLPLAIQRRFSMMNDPSVTAKKLQLLKKERASVSDTESVQRFQKLFYLAVNLIINSDCLITTEASPMPSMEDVTDSPSDFKNIDEDRSFCEYLYNILIECVSTVQERNRANPRKAWYSLLWTSRDMLRVQLGRLMVHMLSPQQDIILKCCATRIAHNPRANHIIKAALQSNHQHDHKVVLYLYDLISNHANELNKQQMEDAKAFRVVLEKAGFMPFPLKPQSDSIHASMMEDIKLFELEMDRYRNTWRRQRESLEKRQLHRLDGLAKEISHCAMDVTQRVVMDQNIQRKKLLEEVRLGMAKNVDIRKLWHDVIQQLTHERAVWYDAEYFPTSWQLDPTEGPARVRRRLQRCHLGLDAKYLIAEKREHYRESCSQPLSYLFEDCHQSIDSTVLISRTQTNEAIKNTAKCSNVTPSSETPGELLIGTHNVYFVGDDVSLESNSTWSKHVEKEVISLSWSYEDIKEIHKRWYQLRDDGLEIFLTNGKTFLLAFENQKERDFICKQLMSMELPNLVELDNIGAITHAWRTGQMTNFEYLTQLNKIAGRTFNDLMQYPVFPFILADYTSQILDLENKDSFRNLFKPIAVQYKEMESVYVDRYKWLKDEYEKPEMVKGVELMPPTEPHHYGSHYSNSGTVLQYVVRLPPFTKMFLQYQDQHFDLPDRTFHSVGTAWRLSSRESTSDVKELIPEFFFLPEFLSNGERYNFGHKQSGEKVDHVILPPWAKQNPRLFVLIHRQALESDYVSHHLHGWIDLVFGYKQKGKAAVEAINVFHPATYFGLDVTRIEDRVKRRAIETMIKTYGQTPKQLFSNPHSQRAHQESIPEVSGVYSTGMFSHIAVKETIQKSSSPSVEPPLKQVKGMKWGNYIGSPTAPEPRICFTKEYKSVVAKLVAVPTGSVCGLAANICLFVVYAKEKGVSSIHNTAIEWSAILSWAHPDGIMRLKQKKNEAANFIHTNTSDQITCCSALSDCRQFFAGTAAGVIMAYTIKFNPARQAGVEIVGNRTKLYGHSGAITSLSLCTPYSIIVSGSSDNTCIVWDLNRLCYIHTLSGHSGPVVATAVSDTMGDIASASRPASRTGGSDLYMWTVNGKLLSQVHCDSVIHSLAFSNAPEGCSVNVIAAGLHTGIIRLWSSWDLKLVREICCENFNQPIISLVFSYDCNFLYASNTEGKVVAWSKAQPAKQKIPPFITFLR